MDTIFSRLVAHARNVELLEGIDSLDSADQKELLESKRTLEFIRESNPMKIIPIALVLISLIGCSTFNKEWEKAPYQYRCTTAEMNRVAAESEYCAKSSGYTADFCYGSAIARICKEK